MRNMFKFISLYIISMILISIQVDHGDHHFPF